MEQEPRFESFDPFSDPSQLKQPIHMDLDEGVKEEEPLHLASGEYNQPKSPVYASRPTQQESEMYGDISNDRLKESDAYALAREQAEMKFNFYKRTAAIIVANAILAGIAYSPIKPVGNLWFCWPLGLSAIAVTYHFAKVFLLRGMDLRSLKERRLEAMALREVRRQRTFE
jgi:2TM domain